MKGNWLSAKEASELLGLQEATLRKRARKGTIPAYKIGKLWKFRAEELKPMIMPNEAARNLA